jgi:hypothetical protein
VEEAPDGAIRTTIGCGAVKRHAASLLQVFTFKQTPILHPASATNLPFFGVAGAISEKPTGDVFPLQLDPGVKNLKLTLTSSISPLGVLSKIEIVRSNENWSLGVDFMRELSIASASNHSTLACLATTATLPAPNSPVTSFAMPVGVTWTGVAAPSGAGFYSMTGTGASVVAMFFHLDMSVSPAAVTSIDWYQGVTGSSANTYAVVSPGRNFTFYTTMPTAPGGLTWYHTLVFPI